ncbi:hypothetical protein BGZ54_007971 [Gamsiella multidivaricata]|nr:hypothetical protein BGZ54_007971 [Gamsiella multidivaricata]
MPSPKRTYPLLLNRSPTYQVPLEVLREMAYLVHESKIKGKASRGDANVPTDSKRLSLDHSLAKAIKASKRDKKQGIYVFPILYKTAKVVSYDGCNARDGAPEQAKASKVRPSIHGQHLRRDPVSSPKATVKGANSTKSATDTRDFGKEPTPLTPDSIDTAANGQGISDASEIANPSPSFPETMSPQSSPVSQGFTKYFGGTPAGFPVAAEQKHFASPEDLDIELFIEDVAERPGILSLEQPRLDVSGFCALSGSNPSKPPVPAQTSESPSASQPIQLSRSNSQHRAGEGNQIPTHGGQGSSGDGNDDSSGLGNNHPTSSSHGHGDQTTKEKDGDDDQEDNNGAQRPLSPPGPGFCQAQSICAAHAAACAASAAAAANFAAASAQSAATVASSALTFELSVKAARSGRTKEALSPPAQTQTSASTSPGFSPNSLQVRSSPATSSRYPPIPPAHDSGEQTITKVSSPIAYVDLLELAHHSGLLDDHLFNELYERAVNDLTVHHPDNAERGRRLREIASRRFPDVGSTAKDLTALDQQHVPHASHRGNSSSTASNQSTTLHNADANSSSGSMILHQPTPPPLSYATPAPTSLPYRPKLDSRDRDASRSSSSKHSRGDLQDRQFRPYPDASTKHFRSGAQPVPLILSPPSAFSAKAMRAASQAHNASSRNVSPMAHSARPQSASSGGIARVQPSSGRTTEYQGRSDPKTPYTVEEPETHSPPPRVPRATQPSRRQDEPGGSNEGDSASTAM